LGTSGCHCQASVEGELQLPLFFFSFNAIVFVSSLLFCICFLVLVRKFFLFCFVVFAILVDVNPKKKRIVGEEEHTSTELANGMGGVMNEGGLEG
jgi:hypothetical protein